MPPSPPPLLTPPSSTQPLSNLFRRKPASSFSLCSLLSFPKFTITLLHRSPPTISFPLKARRFLKIPAMSRCPLENPNNLFPNPQSLSEWLKPRLPSDSFASWGVKPGTKNVHNLWLELSEEETSLNDSFPPVRTVEVVIVRIVRDDKVLVESHQELSDGSVRKRSRPLSEKMKPGETVDLAAIRAAKEELGSIVRGSLGDSEVGSNIVKIIPDSYTNKVEERVSDSYPGLPSCYVLHTVDATVDCLPEGEFFTEEAEEYEDSDEKRVADGAFSCKKHYWKWVDSNSVCP